MATPIATHEQRHLAAQREPSVTDLERLAQCGFTAAESAALLWLRHWDHVGGSDRVGLVRCPMIFSPPGCSRLIRPVFSG